MTKGPLDENLAPMMVLSRSEGERLVRLALTQMTERYYKTRAEHEEGELARLAAKWVSGLEEPVAKRRAGDGALLGLGAAGITALAPQMRARPWPGDVEIAFGEGFAWPPDAACGGEDQEEGP